MADVIRSLHLNPERTFRGGERQALMLMEGLVERGHEAALVAEPDGGLARRAEEAGLTVYKIRTRGGFDPIGFARVCSRMRELEFDIVHMHTGHAHTLGALASLLSGRGKRIVSRRVVSKAGRNWLGRLKYRRGADRYVAISQAVKNVLVEGGVKPERISVVYSCVDVNRFENIPDRSPGLRRECGIAEGVLVVGAVGALCPPKDFRCFIEALPLVISEVPRARFVLVGDGELREDLERRAAALGLGPDRLTFAGWRGDVPEWLSLFDVFVSSSVMEGLGTSVLEALAMKKPVVVTDAGGLPEIVEDGENGLVVPAGDPRALADGITRVLNDDGLRARMAQAGYRMVSERFTPARMVEGTIAVYREVLGI